MTDNKIFMTWKNFKDQVESQEIKDSTLINFIAVSGYRDTPITIEINEWDEITIVQYTNIKV
jgi:hypothetical protein